ncbi:MAG: LysR family transcriptional regulator [Pseudomonadota bacterium]
MYSIPDLQTFVTVARHGGITAGAGVLGISAATASHRIAKLETRLGVQLFHRSSRNFTLSDEGTLFLERIEPALRDIEQAEFEAGGGTTLRGHLRATMSPWILSRFIMPHLGAFRATHPDLTIEFLTVDRYVSLAEEGQDCAIRVGKLADSALISKKLSDNERIICAAPSFLQRFGAPSSVEDLRKALWVCMPWQMQMELAGNHPKLIFERNVTVSNSDMLTDAAVHGLGLAVKSRLAIAKELEHGSLVEIMPGTLAPEQAPIWFLCPPESRNSRKTMAFRDLVVRAFAGG